MPRPLHISAEEIARSFQSEAMQLAFPPVLTLQQFAQLFSVSVRTVKSWIANGDFKGATTRQGKHRRLFRDRAIEIAFSRDRTAPRSSRQPQHQRNQPL